MNGERPYNEISRVVASRRFPGVARSASFYWLCGLAAIAAVACKRDAVIDDRVVTLYTLIDPADAVASSCAVPADAYAVYTGAGDFEPDEDAPPQSEHLLNETRPVLAEIPSTTRQLSLDVLLPNKWRGYGLLPASGDVAVLLWAAGHECELKSSVDARPGGTMTPYDDRHVLVAGGFGSPSFIADLSNGSITVLGNSQDITTTRAFATGTAWSGGVVIAGGTNGVPTSDAEIFSSQSGSFTGDPVSIGVPRANHGATLLANGNVLLVGGGTSLTALYQSLELIDPVARHATQGGLASLVGVGRSNPTVLRLATGEVLVAGGNDSSGTPLPSVEWFSSDASQNIGQASIGSSHNEAFVALPGGGALAVISPDTSGAAQTFVITPDHIVEQAASIASVAPGSPVRLFSGSDGAPLLWTGTNWFRWSPWSGAFAPFLEATSSDGTTLANGPTSDAVIASPDSGLALWLENTGVDAGKVVGLRFDSRGPYSTDVQTLLSTDTQSIAPDRLTTATPDAKGNTLTFDAEGGLMLKKNAAVVLTDATFADFSLGLQTIKGDEPQIFLRDDSGNEFTIGTDASSTCAVGSATQWHVTRVGGSISVISSSLDGSSATTNCGASINATSRVTIGLRGRASVPALPCAVHGLVVRRSN